jgi:CHASE3 domain sensor protein
MGNPIFWRLVLGNAGILSLSVLACLYSIVQLGTLSSTARAALDSDHRMIGYQEALTDSFLSEVRYGGKYIFTHAEDRHQQLDQFKNDFVRYLGQLKLLSDSEKMANSLSKIEQFHRQYHELFDREVTYIRAKQTYAQSRYQQERDKILESVMNELERFKALLQSNLHDKLESMDRAARTARRIAIAATLIVTLLGTWFSFRMSQRLTTAPNDPKLARETDFLISAKRWSKRLAIFTSHTLTSLRRRLALLKGVTTQKGAIKR